MKFTNYRARSQVFYNKKQLKGKRLLITENLTKKRYELFKSAAEKLGVRNVWTSDGRVMTKINDQFINIQDLDHLNSSE